MERVVITGMAPVASLGTGAQFFENLFSGKSVISRMTEKQCPAGVKTKWYVPYPETDFSGFGRDILRMRVMAPPNACTAAVSAMLAAKDAGIDVFPEDTAVYYGVGAPNTDAVIGGYETVGRNAPLNPCTNPMIMTNSVSAWLSILLHIHGVNQVVSTACASGTSAVGDAYRHIANGLGRTAVCGGADCLISARGTILKSFDILGALTDSEDGFPRPFSEERSGFLFSEGAACTLVLEEYHTALQRGARIYAEITGYEANCDAYHIVQMPQKPEYITKMLEKLVNGEQVDYYNAHGTCTKVNDSAELEALRSVFGGALDRIYVNSTKGVIGHSIGASGAIEAAVCAYSIKNGLIHGVKTGTVPQDLRIPSETVRAGIQCAVSASFGFGGHNAALKFRAV